MDRPISMRKGDQHYRLRHRAWKERGGWRLKNSCIRVALSRGNREAAEGLGFHTVWFLTTLFTPRSYSLYPFWWTKSPTLIQYSIVVATCRNSGSSTYGVWRYCRFVTYAASALRRTVSRAVQAFQDEIYRKRVDRRYDSGS